MTKLNTTVYVHNLPFGETKNCFGPSDDVPDWAAAQIGDHCWEGGKPPKQKSDDGNGGPTPPPLSGTGSGVEAWVKYAKAVEVDVEPDAKREDIVEAIKAAGKPVE